LWRAVFLIHDDSFTRHRLRCVEVCVHPEGWKNWGKPSNEQTAYYAEYKCYGEGANTSRRATWGHQLQDDREYDIHDVLKGDDGWNPMD